MSSMISHIGSQIKQSCVDLTNGNCVNNFVSVGTKKQIETALKVTLVALVVTVVFALLAGSIAGAVLGGIAALGAFAYYTNDTQTGAAKIAEDLRNAVKSTLGNEDDEESELADGIAAVGAEVEASLKRTGSEAGNWLSRQVKKAKSLIS